MAAQGGDGDPVFLTVPLHDVATPVIAAFGAVSALYHRERTGEAQIVWSSLAHTASAVQAAELLLDRGVYANVIVVTSPDLLCGELARKDDYRHLTETLGIDGSLHLRPLQDGALDSGAAVDLAGPPLVVLAAGDPHEVVLLQRQLALVLRLEVVERLDVLRQPVRPVPHRCRRSAWRIRQRRRSRRRG